jgi:hypothetical protein
MRTSDLSWLSDAAEQPAPSRHADRMVRADVDRPRRVPSMTHRAIAMRRKRADAKVQRRDA